MEFTQVNVLLKDKLLQMFTISFLKLQIIRKERKQNKQNTVEDEDEEGDSVDMDILKNAKGSARVVKKPETRNTTYEVLLKNDKNACGYLIILFFRKKLECLRAVFPTKSYLIPV